MAHDTPDRFLSRWSQRKMKALNAREGGPAVDVAPLAQPVPSVPAVPAVPQAGAEPAPSEPPPTLADVAQLTRGSDFSRFVAPDVDADVRNAALKKLFSDPHFNVMDGLDTYIDDYNKPDPLPAAMLRQMAQAHFLGLVTEPTEPLPHEDADLRLQPHDAAGCAGPEPGAEDDAGREH
jgi:hypothetical protein